MTLRVVAGPMFSGKTTELMRQIKRFESIGKSVLVINHTLDTRYSNDAIVSHSGTKTSAVMVSKLQDVKSPESDIIAIDEAQFFPDLFEAVMTWVERQRKTVIVAGLIADYKRATFGQILQLIPFCDLDKVHLMTAYCSNCKNGTKASFTKRLNSSNKQIDVGNEYISVCRSCYLR